MNKLDDLSLKSLVEATIFVADKPMSVDHLLNTVLSNLDVSRKQLNFVLAELQQDYQGRGIELKQVASGYRFQAIEAHSEHLGYLWQEKAPKYSRAMLETLALIAYRQPITRGEIEEVRGVSVSSNIIRSLQERNWIKIVGHKEVPGRPALFATTKAFLDYFNMSSLTQLPELQTFDIQITGEQDGGASGQKEAVPGGHETSDLFSEDHDQTSETNES